MDMFPDTALVREIQLELDNIIQQGVRNITRLIRATNPSVTNPLQTQGDVQVIGATFGTNQLTSSKGQRSSRELMDSSLADRLVKDGLLTPDLLRQLQREWSKGQKQEATGQLNRERHNNKGKRGRKNK